MTVSLDFSSHPNLPSPTVPDTDPFYYPQLLRSPNPIFLPILSVPPPATMSFPPASLASSPSLSFPINTLLSHHPLSSLPTPTSALSGPSPTTPAQGKDVPSPSNFPFPSTHPRLPCQAGPGRGHGSSRCLQPRTRCAPTDDSVSNEINTVRLGSSGGQLCAHVQSKLSAGSLPGLVVHGFQEGSKGQRSEKEPKEILRTCRCVKKKTLGSLGNVVLCCLRRGSRRRDKGRTPCSSSRQS